MKTIKIALFTGLVLTLLIPLSGYDLAAAESNHVSSTEKVRIKMIEQHEKDEAAKSGKKSTSEEYGIPYDISFIKNGKLVVGIDAVKAKEFNKKYTAEDVKQDLQTNEDIEVNYYFFQREANISGGDAATALGQSSTITLVRPDNKVILTGHLAPVGTLVTIGQVGGVGCQMLQVQVDPTAPRRYADSAYAVPVSNPLCTHTLVPNTVRYNSNVYSITEGTMADITLNKFIRMAGINDPSSSGYILATSVTAKDPTIILDDQVVANYPSQRGDSGGPVITLTGTSTAKIIGQHEGKFCLVDLNSGDNFAQWCSDPVHGVGALTVFSPWPNVKSNLGLP